MMIFDPGTGKILGVFLKILAIFYFVSALVHVGNLLNRGQVKLADAPPSWIVLDVVFAVLDLAVAVGLWWRQPWGVACLFLAIVIQLVLYLGFPDHFAQDAAQRQAIRGLVAAHFVTLGLYTLLRFLDR